MVAPWWSDFLNVPSIIGSKVISIEDVDLTRYDVEDGRSRQEYDQVYGFTVQAETGTAQFLFRNSSNGYYGGWMESAHLKSIPEDFIDVSHETNWRG